MFKTGAVVGAAAVGAVAGAEPDFAAGLRAAGSLDRDYFTAPEDEIRHVRSVLTVVGGNIVHNSEKVG